MSSIFKQPRAQDFARMYSGNVGGAQFFVESIAEGIGWSSTRAAMKDSVRDEQAEKLREAGDDPFRYLERGEWEQSPYFRQGMEYQDGLTLMEAATNAHMYDQRAWREAVEKDYAGGGKTAMALAGNLIGSVADPINFIPIFSLPGMASKAVRGVNLLDDVARSSYGSMFKREAVENMLAVAATEPFIVEQMKQEGRDVGMNEVLLDVAMGGVIGGTMGLGRKWLNTQKFNFEQRNAAENGVIKALVQYDQTGSIADLDVTSGPNFRIVGEAARATKEKFSFGKMAEEMGISRPREWAQKARKKPFESIRDVMAGGKRYFSDFLRQARESGENLTQRQRTKFEEFERAYGDFMADVHGMSTSKAKEALDRLKAKLARMRESYDEATKPDVRTVWEQEGPDIEGRLPKGQEGPIERPGREPQEALEGPPDALEPEVQPRQETTADAEPEAEPTPVEENRAAQLEAGKKRVKVEPKREPKLEQVFDDLEGRIRQAEVMLDRRTGKYKEPETYKTARKEVAKFVYGFLKDFRKYKVKDAQGARQYAHMVVWNTTKRELEIIRLDREPLRKNMVPMATGNPYYKHSAAKNLEHALMHQYFSKTQLEEMWNRHRSEYRTDYTKMTAAEYKQFGEGDMDAYLDTDLGVVMPKKERVTGNSLQIDDWVYIDWGEKGRFPAKVVKRLEPGEPGIKGGKSKLVRFVVQRDGTGSLHQLDAGVEVEIMRDRTDVVTSEGGQRVLNQHYVDLIEAVKVKEANKAKRLGVSPDSKRAKLTEQEYNELLSAMAKRTTKEGAPNALAAQQKSIRKYMASDESVTSSQLREEMREMSDLEIEDWLDQEIRPTRESIRKKLDQDSGNHRVQEAHERIVAIEDTVEEVLFERRRQFGDEGGDPYPGEFRTPDDYSSPTQARYRDGRRVDGEARRMAEENLSKDNEALDAEFEKMMEEEIGAHETPEEVADLDEDLARDILDSEERTRIGQQMVNDIWEICS